MKALDYDELLKAACESHFKQIICTFLNGRAWVEAKPIKHAYWKTNVYASQVVVCSFCNNTSLVPTTYCANCGAKMYEGAEK